MTKEERVNVVQQIICLVNQMTDAKAEEAARNIAFAQTYYELGRLSAKTEKQSA